MATLMRALLPDKVKKTTVAQLRKEYNKLAEVYEKILEHDLMYCPKCGNFLATASTFYSSDEYDSGMFPICKRCILQMVEQRDKKTDKPNETKQSVINVLRMMNLPYIDSLYNKCIEGAGDGENGIKEKNRKSPFSTYIVCIKSLGQYQGRTFANSEFPVEEEEFMNKKIKEKTKRFFGRGFADSDYEFLQEQYTDWTTRHECKTKTQEEVFKQICFTQLDIYKAKLKGAPTKDLTRTLQDLLDTANLKPKQNNLDSISEAQTMGTLIAKFENTRPIPEPEEEFKDVDKIGRYIDVFFKGHLAKMLNLSNPLSHIYEHFMEKYAAKRPEYGGDDDSEVLFEKIFGKREEDD